MTTPVQFGMIRVHHESLLDPDRFPSGGRFAPRTGDREYSTVFKPERPRDAVEYADLFKGEDTLRLRVSQTRANGKQVEVNGREESDPLRLAKLLQLVGSSNAATVARQTFAEIISEKLIEPLAKYPSTVLMLARAVYSDKPQEEREARCQQMADELIATLAG